MSRRPPANPDRQIDDARRSTSPTGKPDALEPVPPRTLPKGAEQASTPIDWHPTRSVPGGPGPRRR